MVAKDNVVNTKKIREAVAAFRQLRNVELSKKEKSSILDENDRNDRFVNLQLTVKKMSASQKITMVPFVFPHCLIQEDDEVCFIVGCKDGDKGNKRADHERYANEYKQKLRQLGIEREMHILPIMQLETEFKSFEAKRKLCQAFDHFICDHRILFRMPQLLGNAFFRRRKLPIRVYMKDESELKSIVEEAISKSLIYITPEGPNVSIKVGNLHDHSDEQIAENIRAILDVFVPESLPGGEANLNSIHLASFAGRSVPLYVSLASANNVDMSEVDRKFIEKQTPKELEDTIDTLPGVRVKVRSDGKVIAVKDESERLEPDDLLDEDYLDVFREQEFEERDEAKKRQVKHLARKATLRKVGKRFGSNMLKLPSHVPMPKPAGAAKQKLPKQQKKQPQHQQQAQQPKGKVVQDALQGFDEAGDDEPCPKLVPIVSSKIKQQRQTKSLGERKPQESTPLPSAKKAQRKSTTGFVAMPDTPQGPKLNKNNNRNNRDFVVEASPKQTTPKATPKQGMTVTKIQADSGTKKASSKRTIVDTPRPILKSPKESLRKAQRKSVTFDFTPDSSVDHQVLQDAPSTPLSAVKKRKSAGGLFNVAPLSSAKKQKKTSGLFR